MKSDENDTVIKPAADGMNTQNTIRVFSDGVQAQLVTTLQLCSIALFLMIIMMLGQMVCVSYTGLLVLLSLL